MGDPVTGGEPGSSYRAWRDHYVAHFRERLERYGEDVRVLWNSAASQRERFEVLVGVANLRGKSVLDVGCGFGDLVPYLRERGIVVARYRGIDVVPEMVAIARRRYPDMDFACADLNNEAAEEPPCDVVLGSGLFFLPHPDWHRYMTASVERMYAHCREAVAVNFLSVHSPRPDEQSIYAEPAEVLRGLQAAITPRVVLRHDYRLNDFTVYLYR